MSFSLWLFLLYFYYSLSLNLYYCTMSCVYGCSYFTCSNIKILIWYRYSIQNVWAIRGTLQFLLFISWFSRDSVTRFSACGFFHESVFPQPQSILLGPFQIFSKIRGDIHKSRCTTGINDTGGKFFHHFRLALLIPVTNNGNNIRLHTP